MDYNLLSTFASSTHNLINVLVYKLKHKTTDEEEKNRINHYINDIYNRSVKILEESPNDITTALTFEKQDLLYFIPVLDLYITEKWSTVNLDDDVEVECMTDFIYMYSALRRYYKVRVST